MSLIPFVPFAHSGFDWRRRKMFGRAVKNIIRKELLGKGQRSQRTVTRAILTSHNLFQKHHLADNENDIIVYSPFQSINYPNCTIDQYVWQDFNRWSSKIALVREIRGEKFSRTSLTFTVKLFTKG